MKGSPFQVGQKRLMYSSKRDNRSFHGSNQRKNDILPKLPPLVTRESFLEKSKINDEYYAIQGDITRYSTETSHITPTKDKEQNFKIKSSITSSSPLPQKKINNPSPSNNRFAHIESPRYNKVYSPLHNRTHRPPPPPQLQQTPFISTQHSKQSSPAKKNTNIHKEIESHDSIVKLSDLNLQDNSLTSNGFAKPPQVTTTLRDISGLSRVSESIESFYSYPSYTFNDSSARHSSYNSLLGGKPLEAAPSVIVPTHPFSISDLDESKLYQCYSVYRLSDIYEWILKIYFEWFTEYIFGQFEFYQMIQRLLEFQIPTTFDQDLIDSNVDKIINSLLIQKAIRFEPNMISRNDEETTDENIISTITIVTAGLDIQGIFTELLPCYSFDDTIQNELCIKCYSTSCHSRSMAISKRDVVSYSSIINKSVGVWADYWNLTDEDLENINPRDVQKQSFIFDLIILEERSLNMANAAVEIYGKQYDPSLLPEEPNFTSLAFDIFIPLINLHTELLLNPINWKIKTRGKFISGIGKLYLRWCHEAHDAYINYARAMATVHEIIKYEKKRGSLFAKWLKMIDNSPEITRSKLYHDVIFFGGFFKSLQNLPITLRSILKNTDISDEDHEYISLAIKEVEKLNEEVDKVHGDAIDHRNLIRFSRSLMFDSRKQQNTTGYSNLSTPLSNTENLNKVDPLIEDKLDLGLLNSERKLIYSGPVFKKREAWLDPSSVYIALLDNYFLITEITVKNNKNWYKLIERPIPIEYLSIERKKRSKKRESWNSDQSSTNIQTENVKQPPLNGSKTAYFNSSGQRVFFISDSSSLTSTSLNNESDADTLDFKIRNTATNESFTFITSSMVEKEIWITSILKTIQKSKERIQSVVEFEILSTRFAYTNREAPLSLPVAIEGSEIEIALKKYENKVKEEVNMPLTCTISASAMFTYEGKNFLLVACNYGIFLRLENGLDNKFQKVINCDYVTKLEVNCKLGIIFILNNHNLLYFSLASILGAYYDKNKYLSDNTIIGIVIKDKVDCFRFAEDFGNSKHLIFTRKGKIYVLTPEFDRINRQLKYFKEYKQYRLPTVLHNIENVSVSKIVCFKKSFIVCTSKGVILFFDEFGDDGITLPIILDVTEFSESSDKLKFVKTMFQEHNPSYSSADALRYQKLKHILKEIYTNGGNPLNCFQLNNGTDFILVYDKVLIKINCHGILDNWKQNVLMLDFYCINATLFEGYMILVSESLIQIYDINKAIDIPLQELIPCQIIKGKKIQLLNRDLNDNFVILNSSHPNIPNRQLLLKCNITNY